jgi:hypothetical protein
MRTGMPAWPRAPRAKLPTCGERGLDRSPRSSRSRPASAARRRAVVGAEQHLAGPIGEQDRAPLGPLGQHAPGEPIERFDVGRVIGCDRLGRGERLQRRRSSAAARCRPRSRARASGRGSTARSAGVAGRGSACSARPAARASGSSAPAVSRSSRCLSETARRFASGRCGKLQGRLGVAGSCGGALGRTRVCRQGGEAVRDDGNAQGVRHDENLRSSPQWASRDSASDRREPARRKRRIVIDCRCGRYGPPCISVTRHPLAQRGAGFCGGHAP